MKSDAFLWSQEAEWGTLSSMLTGSDQVRAAIIEEIGETGVDWFHDVLNGNLYHIIVYNWRQERSLKLDLLTKRLHDSKRIGEVGGAARITDVYCFCPTAANFRHYLEALKDKRWLRYVHRIYTDGLKMVERDSDDVQGILSAAEEHLSQVVNRQTATSRQREIKAIVSDVIESLDKPERILGISTGYANLDAEIGGLAGGDKIVVAAPISCGKSSFADCIANSVAVSRKVPTLMFSFEMTQNQVAARIIQVRSEVSTRKLARGEGELWEHKAYSKAASEVAEAPLWIVEEKVGLNGMRAKIMQLRPRLVIIDYAQIMREPKQRGENRTDQLDRMSAETKNMAGQFNCTVIELSQLTETEKGPRTKGSSAITADCNILLSIKDISDAKTGYPNKEIVIAKNRDGERGQHLPFLFKSAITKFVEPKN